MIYLELFKVVGGCENEFEIIEKGHRTSPRNNEVNQKRCFEGGDFKYIYVFLTSYPLCYC